MYILHYNIFISIYNFGWNILLWHFLTWPKRYLQWISYKVKGSNTANGLAGIPNGLLDEPLVHFVYAACHAMRLFTGLSLLSAGCVRVSGSDTLQFASRRMKIVGAWDFSLMVWWETMQGVGDLIEDACRTALNTIARLEQCVFDAT